MANIANPEWQTRSSFNDRLESELAKRESKLEFEPDDTEDEEIAQLIKKRNIYEKISAISFLLFFLGVIANVLFAIEPEPLDTPTYTTITLCTVATLICKFFCEDRYRECDLAIEEARSLAPKTTGLVLLTPGNMRIYLECIIAASVETGETEPRAAAEHLRQLFTDIDNVRQKLGHLHLLNSIEDFEGYCDVLTHAEEAVATEVRCAINALIGCGINEFVAVAEKSTKKCDAIVASLNESVKHLVAHVNSEMEDSKGIVDIEEEDDAFDVNPNSALSLLDDILEACAEPGKEQMRHSTLEIKKTIDHFEEIRDRYGALSELNDIVAAGELEDLLDAAEDAITTNVRHALNTLIGCGENDYMRDGAPLATEQCSKINTSLEETLRSLVTCLNRDQGKLTQVLTEIESLTKAYRQFSEPDADIFQKRCEIIPLDKSANN